MPEEKLRYSDFASDPAIKDGRFLPANDIFGAIRVQWVESATIPAIREARNPNGKSETLQKSGTRIEKRRTLRHDVLAKVDWSSGRASVVHDTVEEWPPAGCGAGADMFCADFLSPDRQNRIRLRNRELHSGKCSLFLEVGLQQPPLIN